MRAFDKVAAVGSNLKKSRKETNYGKQLGKSEFYVFVLEPHENQSNNGHVQIESSPIILSVVL